MPKTPKSRASTAPLTLRPGPPPLCRVPLLSGSSLRPTRHLRRHPQYYTPIRHPNADEAEPPVSPWPLPSPVTIRRKRSDFPGSGDVCVYMMWSPTPAAPGDARHFASPGVAFGQLSGLGNRDESISWPNTHPAHLLSTLRPARCRFGTQDSLRGIWLGPTPTGLAPARHRQLFLAHSIRDLHPMRLMRGFGTKAASRAMKSIGSNSRWVVPFCQGVFMV